LTLRVGLTGGIGSGKSELCHLLVEHSLAEQQVPLLDLDAVGRSLHSNPVCAAALVDAFGTGILDESGAVDRKLLAALCFSDAQKTQCLNHIMHPLIWQRAEAWCAEQNAAYVLIEASVLIESGGVSRMDAVVVVLADVAIRRQRVLASRNMTAAQFEAIVERQCSDAERREVADFIIENNDGLDGLAEQADILHQQLVEMASVRK